MCGRKAINPNVFDEAVDDIGAQRGTGSKESPNDRYLGYQDQLDKKTRPIALLNNTLHEEHRNVMLRRERRAQLGPMEYIAQP